MIMKRIVENGNLRIRINLGSLERNYLDGCVIKMDDYIITLIILFGMLILFIGGAVRGTEEPL